MKQFVIQFDVEKDKIQEMNTVFHGIQYPKNIMHVMAVFGVASYNSWYEILAMHIRTTYLYTSSHQVCS